MKNIKNVCCAVLLTVATCFSAVADEVESSDSVRWAQVRVSVACMRSNPGHSSELASQTIMGTPVKILKDNGKGWYHVETPEGYKGWVIDNSLVEKSEEEMKAWRGSGRWTVTSLDQAIIYRYPDARGVRDRLSDAVNGSILEGMCEDGVIVKVKLPDGREGYIDRYAVTPIDLWANQPYNGQKILDIAYSMEGLPYLWGGTSTKSADCSGLTRLAYYSNGIIITRDASQQAVTGKRVEAADWRALEAGDLLFFGNAATQRVTHVAIYDRDGDYVHSSGRVKRNSVDPQSEAYLTTPFLWAVKIHGSEGTDGITKVANHPWYFDRN